MSSLFMSSLFGVPVDLAYHLVCWLAAGLGPLLGGLAAAAAIIVFTIAVRLIVFPLSYYALRAEGARSRLAPKVQELRKRHAQHPERLQRELSALYKAEGSGMFAGCLPLLLQVPFFSVMYRLFLSGTVGGAPNTLLAHDLLRAPLGSHWLSGAGPFSAQGLVFVVLFALLGVVAVFSVRAAQRSAAPAGRAAQANGVAQGGGTAQGGALMAGLTRVMPFLTVVMAAVVPLAAGLYLLTTTAWTVTERALLRRRFLHGPGRAGSPDR